MADRKSTSSARPSHADQPASRWHIAAAIGGWLIPGLGHWLIGQKQRGAILAASIGLLWLAGLAIGGIGVINRNARLPFLGQMLIGPSLVVDMYRQDLGPQRPAIHPDDPQPDYTPSFGRANEHGTLYTALAGLLNLLAIIDVIYRDPRADRVGARAAPDGAPRARGAD